MTKIRQSIEGQVQRLHDAINVAKSKNLKDELAYKRIRWLCMNDLYFLARFTGHDKLIVPFHRDLCDRVSLMNWVIVKRGIMPPSEFMLTVDEVDPLPKQKRLYLDFRSALKTTIVTTCHTIQLLLNFPEIHCAICHNTQVNASDILEGVKNLFLNTELKRYFPEYLPRSSEWGNKTGFSVACRKNFVMKGDSVEAIGIGTEVVGRKYHIFKNDDIVTDKSVTNEEQLKQSRDYIPKHKSLFVNPSVVVEDYCGTKYHFADAYSTLEEDPSVEVDKIPLLIKDPLGDFKWDNEEYRCVLPLPCEGWNRQGILELMQDTWVFNCQYMLNPKDPKKVKFTEDMIQTYQYIPEGLNRYLLIDSADSEEKRACYTAMEVWGIDNNDNWYWLDGVFDKIDDRNRIDASIELAIKWRVYEVLWEILSYGRTDQRNFERASRLVPDAKRTWTTPRIIKASKQSKDDRILGLNDRYSRHKVFWPPQMNYYSKFEGKTIDIVKAMEYEFKTFPLCSHKDLLDCNSFLLQIDLIPGDRQSKPEPSKFAHIVDPVQRGNSEVFWHNWDIWKANGFATPQEVMMGDNL